jgi:hypothetical protein
MVRKITLLLVALVILVAFPLQAGEWTGWITASEGHNSCALKCAEKGAALVFYNTGDEKIYKLSDQDAAKAHIGHKVKVTGELTESTIKVESIKKAE